MSPCVQMHTEIPKPTSYAFSPLSSEFTFGEIISVFFRPEVYLRESSVVTYTHSNAIFVAFIMYLILFCLKSYICSPFCTKTRRCWKINRQINLSGEAHNFHSSLNILKFVSQMTAMPASCDNAFQTTPEGTLAWHWVKVQQVWIIKFWINSIS